MQISLSERIILIFLIGIPSSGYDSKQNAPRIRLSPKDALEASEEISLNGICLLRIIWSNKEDKFVSVGGWLMLHCVQTMAREAVATLGRRYFAWKFIWLGSKKH